MHTFTAEQKEIYIERSHFESMSEYESHAKETHSTKHRYQSVVRKKTA